MIKQSDKATGVRPYKEVIKLVTQQLVPCGKTLVYNAIDSTTASLM